MARGISELLLQAMSREEGFEGELLPAEHDSELETDGDSLDEE